MQAADAGYQLRVYSGMFDRCFCKGICMSDQSRPLSTPTKRILMLRQEKEGARWFRTENKNKQLGRYRGPGN